MPRAVEIVVSMTVVVAAGLLFLKYVGPYVFDYRITDRDVRVVLFGVLPMTYVSFNRIEEIKVATLGELSNPFDGRVKFWNRPTRRAVLIRTYGWGPGLVITPEDPEGFVEEVRRRLSREALT